jgi:hypothetical protein
MSSAVSYQYRVQEEELRRRRELQAARDALLAAQQRYERLCERAAVQRQSWGDSITVPDRLAPASAPEDAAQLRSAAAQIKRTAAAAEKRLDDEVVGVRIATFREGMASSELGVSAPIAAEETLAQPRPGPESESNDDEEEVEETLARLIGRLDPSVEDHVAEQVRTAGEFIRNTKSVSSREQGIGALRLRVQEANAEARERRERECLLDRSEAQLSGFDGPEAGAARRLLTEIRAGEREAPADLEAIVDAAIEGETRVQEAEYVAEELRGALEGLGYKLGPDFATTLLSEGYTQFTRSEWAGYAVRVRSGGRPPHLNFNVVRGGVTRTDQKARDREVEEEFCDRQVAVVKRLARAGISAERTRVVEPGEQEMQVVEGLEEAAASETSRSAAREMGR